MLVHGYDPDFLGVHLPLPRVRPERESSLVQGPKLKNGLLAEYPNYAVLTDAQYRAPVYAVALLDQTQMKATQRTTRWKIDSRIGAEYQLDNAYYAKNDWDRGHMARRETAAWASTQGEAQNASDETFYFSNACIQHANLNQDEWLALEDWVQELEIAQDGKVVVFSGPVYGDIPRTLKPTNRKPAEIPAAFFKVVAFVNNGKQQPGQAGQLDVRAFLMFQDEAAISDKDGRKAFNFQSYQVTVKEIEEHTSLDFPDEVYERNPLYYHPNPKAVTLGATSFPERIDVNSAGEMIGHGEKRLPVRDDEIEVYILAAMVKTQTEWVALLNLEADTVLLDGWELWDKQGRKTPLAGPLKSGESLVIATAGGTGIRLSDRGGTIKLMNDKGEQVDHVDYTLRDLNRAGQKPIFFPTYRQR